MSAKRVYAKDLKVTVGGKELAGVKDVSFFNRDLVAPKDGLAYFTPKPADLDLEIQKGTYANTFSDPPMTAEPTFASMLAAIKKLGVMSPLESMAMPPNRCTCASCTGVRSTLLPETMLDTAMARARELGQAITLRNFAIHDVRWRIEMSWPRWQKDVITIVTLFPVPDRETGAPRNQEFSCNYPVHDWVTRPLAEAAREVAGHLRALLRKCVEHEIDEAIHMDGARIFDPHLYPFGENR